MFKQRRSLGGPNSPSSPLKQEINQSNNGKVLNQKTLEASVGHSRAMMLEDMCIPQLLIFIDFHHFMKLVYQNLKI